MIADTEIHDLAETQTNPARPPNLPPRRPAPPNAPEPEPQRMNLTCTGGSAIYEVVWTNAAVQGSIGS